MLDINFIRKNTKIVKKAAKDKGYDVVIDKLSKVDDKRRVLIEKIEKLREDQNKISKGLKGKPSKAHIQKSKVIKKKIDVIEPKLRKVEKEVIDIMLLVPNIPSKESTIGKDETHNKVTKKVLSTSRQ